MKYFDLIKPNIDSFGVITQSASNNWDGGDTAQREGMFLCGIFYLQKGGHCSWQDWDDARTRYNNVIGRLNYSKGWSLRRHPDTTKWYGDVDRMSRDQLTSNIVALGFANKVFLRQMLVQHIKRALLFTTNTRKNFQYKTLEEHLAKSTPDVKWDYKWKLPDITFSSIWAAYIRGLDMNLLSFLLPLLDLELLIGSLITLYKTKKDPQFCDHLSHQMLILQAHHKMPSFVSKLAMWVYKKANPQRALDLYFTDAKSAPHLNEVYREIWASI